MQPGLLLAVLASALLLILSFPGPGIGPLALAALVPMMASLEGSGFKKAFLGGWAAGTIWFFFSYNWVTHSLSIYGGIPVLQAEAAIGLLAGIHGFYIGLFSMMIPAALGPAAPADAGQPGRQGKTKAFAPHRLLTSPITPFLVLPSAWVVLEVARGRMVAPFPWLKLGSAALTIPFAGNLFEFSGVYGVSWWIVFVNILIVTVWRRRPLTRGPAGFVLAVGILAPLILYPAGTKHGGKSLKVGVVQGNYPQELKWEESLHEETLQTYLDMSAGAARLGARIVVWPETAVPSYYQAQPEIIERLRLFTARHGVHLVFGSPGYEISGRDIKLYNRVYHLAPDGEEEFYDKNVLVPFGEYVPFADLLPFIDRMVPGEGEFATGDWKGPFQSLVPSGALVCFEIAFPSLARREVSSGSRMLLNVTNDAWFGPSWGPYQHLAVSAVRAMENRVPVVRAANTGVSAIIDSRGRILKKVDLDTRGFVVSEVRAGGEPTFYTRSGDWIVFLSAAVISVYGAVYLAVWRSRRWTV